MKKNLFVINESERERILGMHQNATERHYLSEAGPLEDTEVPVATAPAAGTPAAPAPATPAPAATTPTPAADTNKGANVVHDANYEYRKDGDKYYFRIAGAPTDPKVQAYKKQGKYVEWTQATNQAAINAIKKMPFNTETSKESTIAVNKPTSVTPTNTTLAGVKPATGTPAPAAGTPTTAAAPTTATPDVMADLKSASQIRQDFRQGKRDLRQIQRQYDKMYKTYNRLSDKMDKATSDQYLTAMSNLKNQIDNA